VALVVADAPAGAQTPAFSSRVEAVRVDVLVTDRGAIVRGLQPEDFEVFDNGVLQQADLVTFEGLPLKVVMVLDTSASVAGERLEHLREAGRTLLDRLTPDDEAALITFSHAVSVDAPLTTDRSKVHAGLARARGFGRTALVDATHTGIVLGESGVGRSLLIVFSDGVDTASWLPPDSVLDTARRTDVVAYFVSAGEQGKSAFNSELTSLTGGSLIQIASTRDLSATFLRILDEFRHRYLVSYTPRGVASTGWHRLEVRVKGRRATVRARPGYLAGN
jgi:Ca-activated chloride channel family protein